MKIVNYLLLLLTIPVPL